MLIKFKPTTPGLRGTVLVSKKELSKNKPHKSLTRKLNSTGGRNNQGRITSRRMGGGVKRKYRQKLVNSTATVLFENKAKDANKYFGRDEYFNSVIVTSDENLSGKIKKVKLDSCNQNTLFGQVVLENNPKEYAA